jgi:hypothetical protein
MVTSIKSREFRGRSFVVRRNLLGAFCSAVLLGGCASTPIPPAAPTQDAQIAEVLKDINDSTKVAVGAQRELALTLDARAQRDAAMRQRLLTDVVSYDFYGDVETIVREIAVKYGYDFLVVGKRPPEGVPINVFVKNRPVLDVLKHIGVTADFWLSVVVKPGVIEIQYRSTGNGNSRRG